MRLTVEVKERESRNGRRLVFAGDRWDKLDLCIHGQQLRWHCAECADYFKDQGNAKPKKRS